MDTRYRDRYALRLIEKMSSSINTDIFHGGEQVMRIGHSVGNRYESFEKQVSRRCKNPRFMKEDTAWTCMAYSETRGSIPGLYRTQSVTRVFAFYTHKNSERNKAQKGGNPGFKTHRMMKTTRLFRLPLVEKCQIRTGLIVKSVP